MAVLDSPFNHKNYIDSKTVFIRADEISLNKFITEHSTKIYKTDTQKIPFSINYTYYSVDNNRWEKAYGNCEVLTKIYLSPDGGDPISIVGKYLITTIGVSIDPLVPSMPVPVTFMLSSDYGETFNPINITHDFYYEHNIFISTSGQHMVISDINPFEGDPVTFKSNDFGETFTILDTLQIYEKIKISLTGQYIIMLSTNLSKTPNVIFSNDFGETFTTLSSDYIIDVSISSNGQHVCYNGGSVIFISHDFGESFQVYSYDDAN